MSDVMPLTNLHPYPAYKPSGVKWLGHVPEHWDLVRMKYAVQINPETLAEDTDPEYIFDYMDINSVSTGYISTLPVRQVFGNAPSRARRVMRTGDTAISTVRTYLKAAYHLQRDWPDLIASTGFAVLRPPVRIVPALLGHIVQSDAFVRQVVANSVGVAYPAISETKLGTLLLVLPPLPEQRAIVRYLDYVDRRIRRYVSAKRKLIALLEEEKQAIVNRAVTRGLDPNVRLKPSGVEWLGEVPEHWEVRRLSQVSGILRGKFTHRPRNDPSLYDGPYPFIQTGDVAGASKMIMRYGQTLNEQGLAVSTMFPTGTLVMTIAANIGDVAILSFDACFPDSVVGFVPSKNVYRDHLYYLFRAMKREFLREAPVNTQGNLNVDRIGSRKVAIPPLFEQADIVKHLDRATSDTDAAIARAQRQIELLQEYRTRLIADVVTGKLDVREAAEQLPDEPDDEEPIDEGRALADDADGDLYDAGNFKEELAMESEVRA